MSTWASDQRQRTTEWYLRAPHVGHSIEDLLRCLHDLGFKPETLTDLGCGSGHLVLSLAEEYPELEATGFDADETVIRYAQLLASARSVEDRCQFVLRDLARLPPQTSHLTTCLAGRGIFPEGDSQLLSALKALTSRGGVAAVDGIWRLSDGDAARRVEQFVRTIAEMGAQVVCTRTRRFNMAVAQSDAGLGESRPRVPQGISTLWILRFSDTDTHGCGI